MSSQSRSTQSSQSAQASLDNPLDLDGIEFIEFATSQPEVLGQALQKMGFALCAQHRSREVLCYRQGKMNLIVNAQAADVPKASAHPDWAVISAIGLRVHDAATAMDKVLQQGAWQAPARAQGMELNIPAIHGVGESLIYFIDRYNEFSIFDIDFRPLESVPQSAPDAAQLATIDLNYFGVAQFVGIDRTDDWLAFYTQILGFIPLPSTTRFGIMPKGVVLQSPCRKFYWQLTEPEGNARNTHFEECLQRVALSTPDVLVAKQVLEERGINFFNTPQPPQEGAVTHALVGGLIFELVPLVLTHPAP